MTKTTLKNRIASATLLSQLSARVGKFTEIFTDTIENQNPEKMMDTLEKNEIRLQADASSCFIIKTWHIPDNMMIKRRRISELSPLCATP